VFIWLFGSSTVFILFKLGCDAFLYSSNFLYYITMMINVHKKSLIIGEFNSPVSYMSSLKLAVSPFLYLKSRKKNETNGASNDN